jgi:hypothetical protein
MIVMEMVNALMENVLASWVSKEKIAVKLSVLIIAPITENAFKINASVRRII